MKLHRIFALLLVVAAPSAHAQQDRTKDVATYCAMLATVARTTAHARDLGVSRSDALEEARQHGGADATSLRLGISVINDVYDNPTVPTAKLTEDTFNSCLKTVHTK
jgi:Tfp pilus assembly protein FimT